MEDSRILNLYRDRRSSLKRVLLSGALFVLLPTCIQAAVINNDTFEQYSLGQRPLVSNDGNSNFYIYSDIASTDATVQAGSSTGGVIPNQKSFHFLRSAPTGADAAMWHRDFPTVNTGFLRVSFKIKTGALAGNFAPQFVVRNTAGLDAIHLRMAPNEKAGTRPGFSLLVNSTSPAVYDPLIADIIPENWYEFDAVFDLTNKTFDLTIENLSNSSNGQFAQRLNVPFRAAPPSLQRFLVGRTITNFVYLYDIDDMRIETISQKPSFQKHGGMVPISEKRGLYVTEDSGGNKLILLVLQDVLPGSVTPRTSLLIIDTASGQANQYFWPSPNTPKGDAFCLFVSSAKKVYFGMYNSFAEFDLGSRTFTHFIENIGGYTMSMDESIDGMINLALYPSVILREYDPSTGNIQTLVDLDSTQQYPTRMCMGNDGWAYVGIGTEKANIVAYNAQTSQLTKVLSDPSLTIPGSGVVYKDSQTGEIYGKASPHSSVPWMKFSNGVGSVVPGFDPNSINYPGASLYWTADRSKYVDGSRIENFSLETRTYDYVLANGSRSAKTFAYQSAGASIDSMVVGNDGLLYGSTGHPAYLWKFDPTSGSSTAIGAVKGVGSGSLTNFVNWQGKLISNSYAEGRLYCFDPTLPYAAETTNGTGNPRWLSSSVPDVGRPRTIVLSGNRVISTGWPSYGLTGGGMLLYDLGTSTKRLISAPENRLVANQSVSAMHLLSSGNIVFGTSARTPGGGIADPNAYATLGEFDPTLEQIIWQVSPLGGEREISDIHVENGSVLYGVTLSSKFFVYSLSSSTLYASQDLSAYGTPAVERGDTAFVKLLDGRLLLVMKKAILLVDQNLLICTKLADTPGEIYTVGLVMNQQLYLGIGGRLWSYSIPSP